MVHCSNKHEPFQLTSIKVLADDFLRSGDNWQKLFLFDPDLLLVI
jgi:hypothetical protein